MRENWPQDQEAFLNWARDQARRLASEVPKNFDAIKNLLNELSASLGPEITNHAEISLLLLKSDLELLANLKNKVSKPSFLFER